MTDPNSPPDAGWAMLGSLWSKAVESPSESFGPCWQQKWVSETRSNGKSCPECGTWELKTESIQRLMAQVVWRIRKETYTWKQTSMWRLLAST